MAGTNGGILPPQERNTSEPEDRSVG